MSSEKRADLTTKKNNSVVAFDIEKYADQGFDNVDSKVYSCLS